MLMVKVKGNIVQRKLKGLSYNIKVHPVEIEGNPEATPYVEWSGEVDQQANEITGNSSKKNSTQESGQLAEAVSWLNEHLRDGAKPLEDIEHVGKQLYGFSERTLRRARSTAGFKTFVSGKQKARDGRMRDTYSCRLAGPIHAVGTHPEVEVNVSIEDQGIF
jgi:hypothetical protein